MSLKFESEECLQLVEKWIRDCLSTHSDCDRPANRGTLPKRVVDVGSVDGRTKPKVYETNGESGQYAALSHCWGSIRPIETTRDTLAVLKHEIRWAELPNTFKDAITLTRRLGLKYLWIDSLCIVQDDARDWELESAKMASIFKGAYLTIAATAAADSSFGCFPRGKDYELLDESYGICLPVFVREKRSDDCFLPLRVNRGMLVPPDMKLNEFLDHGLHPLQKRAWCFQELSLSTRTIHFTHSEIVWHCKSEWHCECGGVELGGSSVRRIARFWNNPAGFEEIDEFKECVRWPQIDTANLTTAWYRIVEIYSSKHLTFQRDILPALSGLAKQIQRLEPGRYLAGLWEKSLPYDLAWMSPIGRGSHRRTAYHGPTFSWSSHTGRVQWPDMKNDVPRITVIEACCIEKGADPTGEVSSAFIKVQGCVATAHLVHKGDVSNEPHTYCIERPDKSNYNCCLDTKEDCQYSQFYNEASGIDERFTTRNIVYCLQILEGEAEYYGRHNMPCESRALLLRRSTDTTGAFERIGVVYNVKKVFFKDGQQQEIVII